jgi:fibronectin type 3 domain-containing protein
MKTSNPLRVLIVASVLLIASACANTPQPTPSNATPSDRSMVADAKEGAIELNWEAPEDRVNGAPLRPTDIAGYRIYIGEAPGTHNRTVDIKDPQKTRHVVRGLEPGETYYIAITTIDREGRESPKSEEIDLAAAPLTDQQFAESAPAEAETGRTRSN